MPDYRILPIPLENTTLIKAASALIWRVFKDFEPTGSTRKGISMFKKFILPNELQYNMKTGAFVMFAAFVMDIIVGVIVIKDNHISLLFVDGAYHRKGIGKSLVLFYIENYIKSAGTFKSITVNASLYGVSFYKALGFSAIGDVKLQDGLVSVPMELPVYAHTDAV